MSLTDQLDTSAETLLSTTDELLDECSIYRILIVGRSGCGKSSLVNAVFGQEAALVEHGLKAGECDIETEITFPNNPHLILHDSQGFAPGDTANFKKVEDFIKTRSDKKLKPEERLHGIWLCLKIPAFGESFLEEVEERLLVYTKHYDVPMICVLTQLDTPVKLCRNKRKKKKQPTDPQSVMTDFEQAFDQRERVSLNKIETFPTVRVSVMPGYEDTLQKLVTLTMKRMEKEFQLVFARVQQQSADLKIKASITIGKKKYWRGLSSSLRIPGNTLYKWFDVVHKDIVASWGFIDPQRILSGIKFKKSASELQKDLIGEEGNALARNVTLGTFSTVMAVVPAVAHPAAPITAPIAATVIFAVWIYAAYQTTPQILRALMGYIIDMTMIMQHLFWLTLEERRNSKPGAKVENCHITKELLATAVQRYKDQGIDQLHTAIQECVTAKLALNSAKVLETIERLINEHRVEPHKTTTSAPS